MLTLSYGYKKPQAGDKGTPLFQALEENIQRVNDHNHDGVNSPALTAQSLQGIPQSILAANWVAFGPTGHYRQLVTMFAGFNFDTCYTSFRKTTGEMIYPTVERFSATQFYVYTTDPTLDFVAVYGG
jgi:hypothetical protein